ncbi:RNase P modulator RnpM [Heyndrickxia ginsengihumi]|uniref:RNA-binding protein n=1 Tax=Heyndrickxia ginsengihumi TaxID=363870 RepID=A0A0A6VIS0_9BACI|nr:YlxR family protein [Heyndrickxia ginsengihumi]KHD86534.1 RNA-binding protein [Heyndrickxia ginsengihumi]MBE6182792.1 YlxR family protein [Bacillus sp. (in: firmicutes)]MCM3022532.1 YlxR family protein [Heyndrickxia ginsengihumi]NEY19652.1 YlxR family protein [Heyndrickxia ginsengihumi]
MATKKKIPMRKCVATGEMRPKKEMLRIVRSKEGDISIDPTGKKSGRGAYLSKDIEAIEIAKKKNVLANHLEVTVADSFYDEILEFIKKENH